MTTTETAKPWDFSHVLDLVNSLSFQDSPSNAACKENEKDHFTALGKDEQQERNIAMKDFATPPSSLGDFSKLFKYLGTPASSPRPSLPVSTSSNSQAIPALFTTNTDYTSDGATHSKTSTEPRRTVRWQDFSDTDDQPVDAVSDSSVTPESPTLTKSQRKKQNRRERKAQEAALETRKRNKKQLASVSESEADFISRKAPAKKASIHAGDGTAGSAIHLRERDVLGEATNLSTPKSLLDAAKFAAERLQSAKQATKDSVVPPQAEIPPPSAITNNPSTPKRPNTQPLPVSSQLPNGHKHFTHNARPSGSASTSARPGSAVLQFLPATVGAAAPPQLTPFTAPSQTLRGQSPAPQSHQIRPMIVRSGEDRHYALFMKLIGDYFEDRKYLISPMNLTTHNNDPSGIHVFVDASNIFIGFNDQLKRSRGIPPWTQIPPVDLSFDALALLMERRRPVAKRVLAGSKPWLPAFDKAKAVGYECSILEKVYKARELTERQIYFKEHDRFGVRKPAKAPPANNVAAMNGGSGGGSGSGSETNTPQYAPARMIEQGVDEILHLKILESIVDSDHPTTIVLATGDAAQAEYSQGFMAMAERALKKGWTIELVSWSKNISAMYRRKEWREAWGERFRIVLLDDYAEELLDM